MSTGSNEPNLAQIGGRLSRSSSFSTINSIGFERSAKSRSSLRDGSLTRIKNFFTGQKDSDAESIRSGRSGKSTKSGRSLNERGRSTESARRSLQKFSGQKYLVKIELSIRRAGTRPVLTQRTEIVMDNNPDTKNNPKPYFPMRLNDCHLDENGAFMLRAEVLGYPIPVVQFFKDKSNEPLISQARKVLSLLSLESVYNCMMINSRDKRLSYIIRPSIRLASTSWWRKTVMVWPRVKQT